MPPRWPSSSRVVMGQSFCTGASRSSLPRSQSWRTAVAEMGLEMDPSRKRVEEVAGEGFSRSAMPKPWDQRGSPSRTTAAESPGMLFADMKLETAFSMAARFSGGRRFCCAEREEAQKRIEKDRRNARVQGMLFPVNGLRVCMKSPLAGVYRNEGQARNTGWEDTLVVRPPTPDRLRSVDLSATGSLP